MTNRIERLIEELCPTGVRHYAVGELFAYSKDRIPAAELNPSTFVGVDNLVPNKGGRVDSNYVPEVGNVTRFSAGDVLIGNIRPYLKKIWLSDRSGGASGDVLVLRRADVDKVQVEPRFAYYQMSSEKFFEFDMKYAKGGKMPRGSKADILKYRIGVPPLEIQREIVRILDLFTKLEAELEAELEARRVQYLHLADSLLELDTPGTLHGPLGDLAIVKRGASPRPISRYVTDSVDGIPWIKIGDVSPTGKYIEKTDQKISSEGARKSRLVEPGDFVLSNSMSFGRPYISKIRGCIHDGWLAISEFEKYYDADYLYYLLRSSEVQRWFKMSASSGTVSNLNANIVASTVLPVPPLAKQRKIADRLNAFDVLVNDLSSGLPAEISKRRQQYEYYRDRLLTFKELNA